MDRVRDRVRDRDMGRVRDRVRVRGLAIADPNRFQWWRKLEFARTSHRGGGYDTASPYCRHSFIASLSRAEQYNVYVPWKTQHR